MPRKRKPVGCLWEREPGSEIWWIRYRVEGWRARLEMCQWRRETLDKESLWDEARSTNLSRW
jgi:hypothetical protein